MGMCGAGISTVVLIGLAGLAGPAAAQISASPPPGYVAAPPTLPAEIDDRDLPTSSALPVDVQPLPPLPPQAEREPDASSQHGQADPPEPAADAPPQSGRADPAETELEPPPSGPRGFEPADAYSRPAYLTPAPVRPSGPIYSNLPPEERPDVGPTKELPPQFRRTEVDYRSREPAGTIIIDTPNTYLYLVLGNGRALRYGIGVGREGFTWSGTERVSKMAEWPDWYPPAQMIERQPYLPRWMAGGEGNPLGARALYLGKTLYRIHGTNQPSTIGSFVSSGCIRLTNDDIADLYGRVQVGTRVVVLTGPGPATASAAPAAQPAPYNPLAPAPRR